MQAKEPSRTARAVARHRAVHQVVEGGAIFRDPFAAAILGEDLEALVAAAAVKPGAWASRLHMAVRSRVAEDALAAAVARGVRQAVVLGAGFDTFALRNPYADLRVFEVDHPATQAWKRLRLAAMDVPLPQSLTFVATDFEHDDLPTRLADSGFDPAAPAFFFWLGVVPYLTPEAIFPVLEFIARVPGSEVVFDYSEPVENYRPARQPFIRAMQARVAAAGEPWISFFDPATLADRLRALGFIALEDLDRPAIGRRFFGTSADKAGQEDRHGPHILLARR